MIKNIFKYFLDLVNLKINIKIGRILNSSLKKYNDELLLIRKKTDTLFLILIIAHWILGFFIIHLGYNTSEIGEYFGTPLLFFGILSYIYLRGSESIQIINSLIIISFSIIFITEQLGRLEMHFHFFIMLATICIYRNLKVLTISTIYVILHTIIFNYFQYLNLEIFNIPIVAFDYGVGYEIVLIHLYSILFAFVILFIIVYRDIYQLKTNSKLFEIVDKQNESINFYLSISKQGIFTFGNDLKIKNGYSIECEKIFEKENLEEEYFPSLFYNNLSKQNEVREILELIFLHKVKVKEVFALLEKEISVNNKNIELSYLLIDSQTIMCVMVDITDKIKTIEKIEKQKRIQEKVFKLISNQKYFKSYLQNTRNLFNEFTKTIDKISDNLNDNIIENFDDIEIAQKQLGNLTIKVHDFKANSGFFGNQECMFKAHNVEDYLIKLRNKKDPINIENLKEKIIDLKETFELELIFIEVHLGAEWINEVEKINITEKDFNLLVNLIKQKLPNDYEIINILQRINSIPISQIFERFSFLIQEMAKILSKKVKPLIIIGREIRVPKNEFVSFSDTLVHIFRNIMYHGIENSFERKWNNKLEEGQVTVNVECVEINDKSFYKIIIEDDGKGLDFKKIAKLAYAKGLIKDKVVTKEELTKVLLENEFSTANNINNIAGRGAGLVSVSREVKSLEGEIFLESKEKQGTKITFLIPNKFNLN